MSAGTNGSGRRKMRSRLMFGALAAAALSVIAFGATGASAASRTVTFHLLEKDHGFNFIDNPPRQGPHGAPLIGDQLAFDSELVTPAGKHAGWLEATCMVAQGGKHASGPCYGIYALKGGTLMGMAMRKFYGNAPTEIAILGGTGAYAGATGTVRSITKSENTNLDTVTLDWAS
jgi:hypothetical protein